MGDVSAQAVSPGNERQKWVIVGGLAIVLVAVLWVQFGPTEEAPPPVELAERPRRAMAGPTVANSSSAAIAAVGEAGPPRAWPKFTLADVLKHNPFAPLPAPEPAAPADPLASEAEPAAPSADAVLSAVKSRRVRAILMTEQGPAAMLDATLVHEGDVIDGVRVVSIRADGVIVEPAER